MIKILITGIEEINKMNIAKKLEQNNDDLKICPIFTTDKKYKDIELNEDNIYYMDPLTVNLSYKNNSIFYVVSTDEISRGVTMDDYYNGDIVCLSIEEFNTIPQKLLNDDNILIIWLDTKKRKMILSESYLHEVKYFQDAIEDMNYMYFLDDDENEIVDEILKYVNCNDEDEKIKILNQNC